MVVSSSGSRVMSAPFHVTTATEHVVLCSALCLSSAHRRSSGGRDGGSAGRLSVAWKSASRNWGWAIMKCVAGTPEPARMKSRRNIDSHHTFPLLLRRPIWRIVAEQDEADISEDSCKASHCR